MNQQEANALQQRIAPVLDRSKCGHLRSERQTKGSRHWVVCVTTGTPGEITSVIPFDSWEDFIATPFYDPIAPLRMEVRMREHDEARARRDYERALSEIVGMLDRRRDEVQEHIRRVGEFNAESLSDPFRYTGEQQGRSVLSMLLQLPAQMSLEYLPSKGRELDDTIKAAARARAELAAAQAVKAEG